MCNTWVFEQLSYRLNRNQLQGHGRIETDPQVFDRIGQSTDPTSLPIIAYRPLCNQKASLNIQNKSLCVVVIRLTTADAADFPLQMDFLATHPASVVLRFDLQSPRHDLSRPCLGSAAS